MGCDQSRQRGKGNRLIADTWQPILQFLADLDEGVRVKPGGQDGRTRQPPQRTVDELEFSLQLRCCSLSCCSCWLRLVAVGIPGSNLPK
jgi:hypothetical protein